MDKGDKMNILVLGASGAGKSTLIKAVSGASIMIGVGEGVTDRIDVYESETWPLRFIDTKGFEYSHLKQRKTIKQVKTYTKEQIKDVDNNSDRVGIDAVWYCVEGTSRRTFSDNIELMNKAIKGWKKIGNAYYFFSSDGVLLTSGTTPDGYQVGADGRWIEETKKEGK